MAEVVLERVTKVFPRGVTAVDDLSLAVADGELLVLVGPSGSGKTTTLRLVAGLEEPTTGTIAIGGREVTGVPPRRRDVALMFQRHALYPHLDVRANLAFGLDLRRPAGRPWRWLLQVVWPGRYRRLREWDELVAGRVAEAARTLDLEGVLDRLPAQLSGGQQQRAALGRALVRRPGVLLLDEPLGSLDARLRAELRHQLHLLHRQVRATIIYVTHDQEEAMTLGDRVAVLHRGKVEQADPPAVVYDRPRNRFVAGFVGWPPMNFADGELAREGERLRFHGPGWSLPLDGKRFARGLPERGRKVTLGIRPEHLRLASPGNPAEAGAGLTMEVALVEMLGGDCLVTLRREGWQVMGKANGRVGLAPGNTVEVRFDLDRAHLFDLATGTALGVEPAG